MSQWSPFHLLLQGFVGLDAWSLEVVQAGVAQGVVVLEAVVPAEDLAVVGPIGEELPVVLPLLEGSSGALL